MPGPVSDSYDPEWGTGANREDIAEAIQEVYDKLSKMLGGVPPLYILDVVHRAEGESYAVNLSERQIRLLRFACERAKESL